MTSLLYGAVKRFLVSGLRRGALVAAIVPALLLPKVAAAENGGVGSIRLPPDFQYPLKNCGRTEGCKQTLENLDSNPIWRVQCGEALDDSGKDRVSQLRNRENDGIAIVVSTSKKALAGEVLTYLDSEGMGQLLDDGRIKFARMDSPGRSRIQEKFGELCATPGQSEDGSSMAPNTAVILVGDKAEAPEGNPCNDNRWQEGVIVLNNLDNIDLVIGEKARDLISNKRQLAELDRHVRRFCQDEGEAGDALEVVVADPARLKRGEPIKMKDIGVDNKAVRALLSNQDVRFTANDLKYLTGADVATFARQASDGSWAIPIKEYAKLRETAAFNAANHSLEDKKKELMAQIITVRSNLFAVWSGSGQTKAATDKLTIEDIRGKNMAVSKRYNDICGQGRAGMKCEKVGGRLIEYKNMAELIDSTPIDDKPVDDAKGAALRAGNGERKTKIENKLNDLQNRGTRCGDNECVALVSGELRGVQDDIDDLEVAMGGAGGPAKGLAKLDSILNNANTMLDEIVNKPVWSTKKIAGVALVAGGGAILIGGVAALVIGLTDSVDTLGSRSAGGFSTQALHLAEHDARYRINDRTSKGTDIAARLSQRDNAIVAGAVLSGVGVAAAVIGGVLLGMDALEGKPSQKKPVSASISPTGDGVVAGMSFTF